MPTFGDETLRDRYAREHADHMARMAKMTPEQIAALELSLHNALAEVDRLRGQAQAAPEAEPVATIQWNRPDCDWKLTMLCEPAHPEGVALNLYESPQHDAELVELLRGLLQEIDRNTCTHDETHRGGAIWEICDGCGAKWADDEGGRPEFKWPEVAERARAKLATLSAKA